MSTQGEAVIEAVASAVAETIAGTGDLSDLPNTAGQYRDAAQAAIRAYLSALDKAGPLGTALIVAPRDTITMGQMDAGERALAGLDLTTATPEQIVQRVYFATVQASPPPPGADTSERQP